MKAAVRLALPIAALLVAGACARGSASGLDASALLPAPTLDSKPGGRSTEVAVFAGGCFWGVQGIYQHVKGVTSAVSGYAGGPEETAEYRAVGTGRTGHAEAVRITFDPRAVSYGRLLQIFFSVAHDPTELNRQGPDEGPAVPVGDFSRKRRTGRDRESLHRTADRCGTVRLAYRHDARAGQAVLPRRGLSPGLPRTEPDELLHRGPRPAEAGTVQAPVSRAVSRQADARRQRIAPTCRAGRRRTSS